MRIPIIASLTLLLGACTGGSEQTTGSDQAPPAASLAVDLSGHGIPFSIEMGDAATLGVDTPTVVWSEESGQLSIWAGDRFSIIVTEEPGDIARLKADLARDPLRTSTIVEEQPDGLIWRSTFPDEDIVFLHFYRVVEAEGRTFIVQDDDRGRFSEADVRRMAGSVRTKQPV